MYLSTYLSFIGLWFTRDSDVLCLSVSWWINPPRNVLSIDTDGITTDILQTPGSGLEQCAIF